MEIVNIEVQMSSYEILRLDITARYLTVKKRNTQLQTQLG